MTPIADFSSPWPASRSSKFHCLRQRRDMAQDSSNALRRVLLHYQIADGLWQQEY